MRIGIIGNGVVGRATAFAWKDHCEEVRTYDQVPERSSVVDDLASVMELSDLIFVCLPEDALDGFFSGSALGLSTSSLFRAQSSEANFVIKSTCPVGTTSRLAEKYGLTNVVHSPEFLTERTALWDACNPSRLVVGYPSRESYVGDDHAVCFAYRKRFPDLPILQMYSYESEFVKLACNAIYAAKVSLFNELRSFADAADMDWDRVLAGILSDGWTGSSHTRVPGPDGERGFGGRCLPKDLEHLRHAFTQEGRPSAILDAVKWRNENIDRRPS